MAIKPFDASRLKLSRAKRHLQELNEEITAYFDRKGMALINEESTIGLGCHAWTVRIREPMRAHLSSIIGDIVHNLRSSLDLLACDLVTLAGHSARHVYFPFCDQKENLDKVIRDRNMHRAGSDVVKRIKALKPYKGGNEILRAIHDLDIKDKHTALIPVLSGGVSPGANVRFSEHGDVTPIPSIQSKIDDDGQALLITVPITGLPLGAELPARFHFMFGFDGSSFEGHELISTLQNFVDTTESVLNSFIVARE